MRISVIEFPGSNCDHDAIHMYGRVLGQQVREIWHRSSDLQNPDLVVLPGGFSYGDYVRTGALARLSPVMASVKKFAESGGPVIGICNGFQILCEAGLLPGVLLQNVGMKFLSQFVSIKVEMTDTPFTRGVEKGSVITCPVAHFEGNYFADPETILALERENRVVFRYCTSSGEVRHDDRSVNVNGSLNSIAGICNHERNVVGLMPHPERAVEAIVGSIGGSSGLAMFEGSVNR